MSRYKIEFETVYADWYEDEKILEKWIWEFLYTLSTRSLPKFKITEVIR